MPLTAIRTPGVLTLSAELAGARAQTDALFRLLRPPALLERPVTDRHRLIFYLGHLEAFDWNLLAIRTGRTTPFHPSFDRLFERGIDPEPGQAPSDTPADWPAAEEIDVYNRRTRDWIDAHLAEADPWVLQMAIEHRHMHAETLAYLIHQLPYDRKFPQPCDATPVRPAPLNPLLEMPGGTVVLGNTSEGFGWDNEFGPHEVRVAPYRMSRFKISNGEYLEFVRAGGPLPEFWRKSGDAYFWHGMFAETPLPLDWPVWTTWTKAAAYAAWRGCTLPTEAQWTHAASFAPGDPVRHNFDYHHWDPIAVDAAAESAAPHQLTGNGWEWTRDVFAPFPGFAPHPLYPGYSADFFDGHHYVMKGASPRTARLLARPGFRNWFRPDYPYMYAGFRLVSA